MSDKINIRYRFESAEKWQVVDRQVKELIRQDTGVGLWPETRSLPPFGIPPAVTKECLEKLEKLDGVIIDKVDED